MKIAILTVPFNNNYGGFLQAFALKQTLIEMGHEVVFVMRRRDHQRKYLNRWKNLIKYLFHLDSECQFLLDRKQNRISVHTNIFVNQYLKPWTKEYYRSWDFMEIKKLDADVFIAGSDQCWRAKYAPFYIDDYFFKPLLGTNKKRISYAASFGVDDFEFSEEMQKSCTKLLEEFSHISVREGSGIKLLEDFFSVQKGKAVEVLDPTFLPSVDVYKKLIHDFRVQEEDSYLFTYILDESEDKRKVISEVKTKHNLKEISQKAQTGNNTEIIEPIELWLSRIYYSNFVVTDSFHGTVFCILFNKPFIVYGNPERGATRFKSLLNKFGLEDRYIDNYKQMNTSLLTQPIDWKIVNEIVDKHRRFSYNFLKNALR